MTTAIITGASRGFGRAVAADLIAAGWDVVLDGRDGPALLAAAHLLGARAHPIVGDVTDPVHRALLVDAARERGGLDLLVNNASDLGPSPLPRLASVPLDALARLFETNVVAPLALIQGSLGLLAASSGAVVNVTSDAAVEAYEGWGAYGLTKASLEQLSNVLSVEHPELRVWWLDPGDMRTAMHQAAFPGEDISDRPMPELVAPAIARLVSARPPSGRVRAAELLAEVAS